MSKLSKVRDPAENTIIGRKWAAAPARLHLSLLAQVPRDAHCCCARLPQRIKDETNRSAMMGDGRKPQPAGERAVRQKLHAACAKMGSGLVDGV
jgi:hypothetical protein